MAGDLGLDLDLEKHVTDKARRGLFVTLDEQGKLIESSLWHVQPTC